jgi:hypothetical protein
LGTRGNPIPEEVFFSSQLMDLKVTRVDYTSFDNQEILPFIRQELLGCGGFATSGIIYRCKVCNGATSWYGFVYRCGYW